MEISLLKNREVFIKGKNGSAVILPIGLTSKFDEAAQKADLVLASTSFSELDGIGADQKAFTWPGEMEVSGISVHCILLYPGEPNSPLAFMLHVDGFNICYISDTNRDVPSEVVEKIGDTDLLILPITSTSKAPGEIIEEIGPKAILPVGEAKDSTHMEAFVNKLGLAKPEVKFKLVINAKSEFKPESMGLYLLA